MGRSGESESARLDAEGGGSESGQAIRPLIPVCTCVGADVVKGDARATAERLEL